MPLPLTVSCFSKIQIGFTFLVPAHPGSPGQKAVKQLCVCVWCRVVSCDVMWCHVMLRNILTWAIVHEWWFNLAVKLDQLLHWNVMQCWYWSCIAKLFLKYWSYLCDVNNIFVHIKLITYMQQTKWLLLILFPLIVILLQCHMRVMCTVIWASVASSLLFRQCWCYLLGNIWLSKNMFHKSQRFEQPGLTISTWKTRPKQKVTVVILIRVVALASLWVSYS